MDGLKNYRVFNRRYRNRRIGEFLKELHLTEGRNTGLGKILRALEKNGSPKPLFETDDERTSFAATIFIHPGGDKNMVIDNITINDTTNGTSNNQNLSDIELKLLSILKDNPNITRKELAEKLSLSTRTIQRYLSTLRDKGYITHKETKKSSKWIILK